MKLDDLHQFIRLLGLQSTMTVAMDLHKLKLLVAIAKEPGLTLDHYAERAEMPIFVAAPFLREMGPNTSKRKRPMVGKLGLIEARDVEDDWRKREFTLTPKGELLLEQLLALGSGSVHD